MIDGMAENRSFYLDNRRNESSLMDSHSSFWIFAVVAFVIILMSVAAAFVYAFS